MRWKAKEEYLGEAEKHGSDPMPVPLPSPFSLSVFCSRLCRIHFLRALYVRNVYKNVWARNAALLSLILQLLRLCCKSVQHGWASVIACTIIRATPVDHVLLYIF